MKISQFQGEFRFLSNFYPTPVVWENHRWATSEHAYQAAKSTDPDVWLKFLDPFMSPFEAKRLGQRIYPRPDWEEIKYTMMLSIVRAKFKNGKMALLLENTGDILIEEGNTWGDVTWGISPPNCGTGKNWLGKILMTVREENRINMFGESV